MPATGSSTRSRWCIYGPHWTFFDDGSCRTCQATFAKANTTFSWELDDPDKRWIPEGIQLRSSEVGEVRSPRERSRHQYAGSHKEVVFTPRSLQRLETLDGQWYIYLPHWQFSACCLQATAMQATYLKRSTCWSRDLSAADKVPIAAGELLVLSENPRTVGGMEAARYPQHAAQHREVTLQLDELSKLRASAPRMALCRYFTSDADALLQDIQRCFADVEFGPGAMPMMRSLPTNPAEGADDDDVALLLPHGGYCNSGYVAAHGFKLLDVCQRRVAFVIGNNHKSWHKFALCDQTWATPLGPVEPDLNLVNEFRELGYGIDRAVHADEHSIENQLPFLRFVQPGIQIVPIGVGAVELEEASVLAVHVARLVKQHHALLLATTDFSHEGPSYGGPSMSMEEVTELTRQKDRPLLQCVADIDAARLLRLSKGSSMCGPGSAAVFLLACRELGLTHAQQLQYLVNTQVTPCGSTTGFASFAFRRPTKLK